MVPTRSSGPTPNRVVTTGSSAPGGAQVTARDQIEEMTKRIGNIISTEQPHIHFTIIKQSIR